MRNRSDKQSKSQIDQLGDRLRGLSISPEDLASLAAYRTTFLPAYEHVIHVLQGPLRLQPTGRPAKSTTAIVDKLKRETIRLSQLQDIAGCRIVVASPFRQEQLQTRIVKHFPGARIVDRRDKPSHGYRAVHILATVDGKLVELQLRTVLQHAWAELSEKVADLIDPAIKYGGGPGPYVADLNDLSRMCAQIESSELSQGIRRRDMLLAAKRLETTRQQLKAAHARNRELAKRLPNAAEALLQSQRKLRTLRSRVTRALMKAKAIAEDAAKTKARASRMRRRAIAAIETTITTTNLLHSMRNGKKRA